MPKQKGPSLRWIPFCLSQRRELPYVLPEVRTAGRLCFRRSKPSRLPTAKLQFPLVLAQTKRTQSSLDPFLLEPKKGIALRAPGSPHCGPALLQMLQAFASSYRKASIPTISFAQTKNPALLGFFLEPKKGIEPLTCSLRVSCSTPELLWRATLMYSIYKFL